MTDKQRVDELRGELDREKAADPVAGLADQASAMAGQAQQALASARDQVGPRLQELQARIQQRPFVAVGVAGLAGYVLRRITA